MIDFKVKLIKKKFYDKNNVKNYETEDLGEISTPILPPTYQMAEIANRRDVKPPPEPNYKKLTRKDILKFCEENDITEQDYYQIEKDREEKRKEIEMLSKGIIIIKNKKYKIDSIDSVEKNNEIIKILNVEKL